MNVCCCILSCDSEVEPGVPAIVCTANSAAPKKQNYLTLLNVKNILSLCKYTLKERLLNNFGGFQSTIARAYSGAFTAPLQIKLLYTFTVP